jgi:hypothetical protein
VIAVYLHSKTQQHSDNSIGCSPPRFVFIMSILEHYSDHDCALLLGCSVRDIPEARARALRELMESSWKIYSRNQPQVQEKK